jgi:cephalosporin hydroxylase
MKLFVEADRLEWEDDAGKKSIPLYSKEAFALINHLWLKIGWQFRTHYSYSWMGRPILQLPEDIVRMQELIYKLRPDFIIETGIAMGGSLLFYASLVKAMNHGRVIGIDVALREHNKSALLAHELASYITLVEGSSIDPEIFARVQTLCHKAPCVLVILDSNHAKEHVLKELTLYSSLVTKDSYLVVADGFKKHLHDVPRGKSSWSWDNPLDAIEMFLEKESAFVREEPVPQYNRSKMGSQGSHFLGGYLRRIQ